ncbi:MAG: hypothetical protein ACMG55_19585, partial [Microcoleus sp.]
MSEVMVSLALSSVPANTENGRLSMEPLRARFLDFRPQQHCQESGSVERSAPYWSAAPRALN